MTAQTTDLFRLEPKSALVEVAATQRLESLEQLLLAEGLTLGPLSPGAWKLDVGMFLEGQYAGLRAVPGGRLEPMALALTAVLPDGSLYQSRPSPRSAAGPDLDALFFGGQGRAGTVRSATLRLFPVPEEQEWRSFEGEAAEVMIRLLVQALSAGVWIWEARLLREGRRCSMELDLRGSRAAMARDRESLQALAKRAGLATVQAVKVEGAQRPVGAADVSLGVERELSLTELRQAYHRGDPLWLHRISLEGAMEVSGRSGAALHVGGDSSALLEAVSEKLGRPQVTRPDSPHSRR